MVMVFVLNSNIISAEKNTGANYVERLLTYNCIYTIHMKNNVNKTINTVCSLINIFSI